MLPSAPELGTLWAQTRHFIPGPLISAYTFSSQYVMRISRHRGRHGEGLLGCLRLPVELATS